MGEQDGAQASAKQRKSRKTSTTNQQNGKQSPTAQRPANHDKEAWKRFWWEQGPSWRTEPEIDVERQTYLAKRRSITPNIEQGLYPFKDIKLNRADIEWLLATHENGRGPVDWNDESQREREGLDLRGANLRQENLSDLPLARMRGGLTIDEWLDATEEQINMAAAQLQGADLGEAWLQGASLSGAWLQGADLGGAQLQGADLDEAWLQGAKLREAQLQEAKLREAWLQGADLREAQLDGARLNNATLSDERHGTVLLADIKWGQINLAVVDWRHMKTLGDEQVAHRKKDNEGEPKDKNERVDEYKAAVRSNRQLAVALHSQGLNEDAARFAYRAQVLQRTVFRLRGGIKYFGQYFFSLFLDLLAGYGYKPWRSFLAYLIVIIGFATSYYVIGQTVGPHLSPIGSVVFSMTSFHGRGFFPGGIQLDDPLTIFAAIEAFVGLLIEVTFIATLTQRLFGR